MKRSENSSLEVELISDYMLLILNIYICVYIEMQLHFTM